MKLRDLIRELESLGFRLVRSGKHLVYGKGSVTVAVPHNNQVNRYTAKAILKAAVA